MCPSCASFRWLKFNSLIGSQWPLVDKSAFVLLWQFETIYLFICFHLYHKRNRLLASKIVQKTTALVAVVLPTGREKFAQRGRWSSVADRPRAGRNVRYKYSRVCLVIVHDSQEFIRKSSSRSNGRSAQIVAGSRRPEFSRVDERDHPKMKRHPFSAFPTTSWWRLSRRFLLHVTILEFYS